MFLDETMTYSSGIYHNEHDSLKQAQLNKYDKIIEMANIRPSDKVLEIGCGWGGFAIRAAERTGCQVTGITISEAQLEEARQRVQEKGLESHINLLIKDYR